MRVKKVLCKKNAIYPFTSVGRPPKEDTIFGDFIHELTKPMVPASIPGVHAVHAVDAAGVHPLCLAIASERFVPYARPENREPMELLKTANALLGFNQVSLSKYLMVAAKEDASGTLDASEIPADRSAGQDARESLDVRDVPAFFAHVLERIDFSRDLHFQTSTTIDTLDYTGTSLNHGSKLVVAAAGLKRRELRDNSEDLASLALPAGFMNPKIAMKGVLAIQWNATGAAPSSDDITPLLDALTKWQFRENYPWVSIVDDTSTIGGSTQKSLDDFIWMTFTRSDPAQDAYGPDAHFVDKHWSIQAPLVIDARIKPRHQKPLSVPETVIGDASKILDNAGIPLRRRNAH